MSGADPDRLVFLAQELVGAGHWAEMIDVQWGRVLGAAEAYKGDATPHTYARLHCECYFMLAAVRQLLRVCKAYITETEDERLVQARARFLDAGPDAINFRDWFEHLDAYFAGVGFMQQRGEVSSEATLSILPEDDRVRLHFDGRTLDAEATKEAAIGLAEVASTVWMEAVQQRMRRR